MTNNTDHPQAETPAWNGTAALASLPIAIDAMGGDKAPGIAVEGAVEAARAYGAAILLVGRRAAIEGELAKHQTAGLHLEIVETDEVIEMNEHPSQALRKKPRASLKLAIDLVRDGKACGAFSAGNSGAIMAAALFSLKRMPGIDRPAAGSVFPTRTGVTFLIDMGANAECKPAYLVQFAAMGVAYMRLAFGLADPSVGLLSNGEEEGKGTPLVHEVRELLAASPLNFKGAVEGNDVPAGVVDVVVTDGFSGNVLLKAAEGTASTILDILREELSSSLRAKIGAALAMPALRKVGKRLDFEEYGGAPLLGVNGIVLILHGRSGPRSVKNAVRLAQQMARQDLIGAIGKEIGRVESSRAATPSGVE